MKDDTSTVHIICEIAKREHDDVNGSQFTDHF